MITSGDILFYSLCQERISKSIDEGMKVKVSVTQSCPTLCDLTPWTVAGQAPLSMEFSRQEYWRG